jgi:hypothetical protein
MNAEVNTPKEKQYIGPYKVVKIFRKSRRRQVLCRNLNREEAMRMVQSFPNSNRSMVVFYKQHDTEAYYK